MWFGKEFATIQLMEKTLQFAFLKSQVEPSRIVRGVLAKQGFHILPVGKEMDPSLITLLFLTPGVTVDELFEAFPWLKQEHERSSSPYLRLFPFIPYHPGREDIDDLFEEGLGEVYEEIFSGEFKPYGWDLDDENTVQEFERVLEENYSC